MSRGPFDIVVYDKNYARKGPVGAVKEMSGELVDRDVDAVGSLEFTVSADNPRMAALTAPGARVVVRYKPEDRPWRFFMSGSVLERGGGGNRFAPWRTFTVLDDDGALDEIECWPNPTGNANQQGDEDAYFTRTGPAETVLKQVLAPNVARQGTVLTIPPSSGLGATVTVSMRFHLASERLLPAVRAAGLRLRVRQEGTGRVLDVTVPPTLAQTLTQQSGIVTDASYKVARPTITRVTLLAGGEGKARVVRTKVDSALEDEYGVKLPASIDARDIQHDPETDPSGAAFEAALEQRMADKLAEGAPKASLSAQLTESGWFRYGVAYDIGTRLAVRLAGEEPIEDSIRRIPFSFTPDAGATFTPQVGEWSDLADDPLIKHVSALTRAVGDLEKR